MDQSPEAGRSYPALDEYVSGDLSALHLWPIQKRDINLPAGVKRKGVLYRVLIVQNVLPTERPDIVCDIQSENVFAGTEHR